MHKNEKYIVSNRSGITIEDIESYVDSLPSIEQHPGITKPIYKTPRIKKRIRFRHKKLIKPHLQVKRKKTKGSIIKQSAQKRIQPLHIIGACVIIIFLFFLTISVVIPTMQGSMNFLVVQSGSMSPEINPGDIVVVQHTNPEEIEVNDIITYVHPYDQTNFITHRVINITHSNLGEYDFQTKGDANKYPDFNIVASSSIIGEVSFVIPYLGYLSHFATSTYGLLILIILPGSIIIISEIRNIIKNYEKIKYQKSNRNKENIKIKKGGGDEKSTI
ncbi:MAG: signal peptidase I [Petrotogales bacterium]